MKLNEKIYEYRKNKAWSQEELADKLAVSRQTISKWEVGKTIPELDKLIKLSKLFDITVDELVKDDIDIISKNSSDENQKNILNKSIEEDFKSPLIENIKIEVDERKVNAIKKLKQILLITILIAVLVIIALSTLYFQKREMQIKEIGKVYREEFRDIGVTESAFITEHATKKENNVITETYREYYVYADKEENRFIKIKEFKDHRHEELHKEIYIDVSERRIFEYGDEWKGTYDNVIEINVEDWSYNIINNYEFISPMDRINQVFRKEYYDKASQNARKIALDLKNNDLNIEKAENSSIFYWSQGEYQNTKNEDYFQIFMVPKSNWMLFSIDNYKNDIAETREIVNMQITKVDGMIEDVTVPELEENEQNIE